MRIAANKKSLDQIAGRAGRLGNMSRLLFQKNFPQAQFLQVPAP
jgi:hypothetical protein